MAVKRTRISFNKFAKVMSLAIVDDHEFCVVMSDKSKRFGSFTSNFEICHCRIVGSVAKVWDDGNKRSRGTMEASYGEAD